MVPLIIRYPQLVRPGSACDKLQSSLDYFPTLLEVAGVRRRPGLLLEGLSMLPLLKEESTVWRDELFLVYNLHHSSTQRGRMRMIRTREWKLIHHYEKEPDHEFYDLKNDPGETVNLYGEPRVKSIQSELERRLLLWEMRTGALG